MKTFLKAGLGIFLFFILAICSYFALVQSSDIAAFKNNLKLVDLSSPPRVSLDKTNQAPSIKGRKVLRFAIAPVLSPRKSLGQYQDLVNYIAKKMDAEPVLLQGGSYAEVDALMAHRECEIALVCTYPYIHCQKLGVMEALVYPVIGGLERYSSLVIVPKDTGVESLLELEGQTFASTDHQSSSGWMYPALWLKQHKKDPLSFFSNHMITGGHDRSILAVQSHRAQAAAVHSAVYKQFMEEKPEQAKDIKVILQSKDWGNPPVVVHPEADEDFKKALRKIFLDMDKDPDGKKALEKARVQQFKIPPEGFYDSVREDVHLWESTENAE